MKKTLIASIIAAAVLAAAAQPVSAAGECQVIYGGGEVCPPSISYEIDKKVMRPDRNELVDNLTESDPRFSPRATVSYRIFIKNNSTSTLSKIDVTDQLPKELAFVSGSGNYDTTTRQLKYTINNLEAGKTHENTITAQVVNEENLTTGLTCNVENTVTSIADNKDTRSDKARICIEKVVTTQPVPGKGGQPVQPGKPGQPIVYPPSKTPITPPTGPEMLGLLGLIPSGIAGYFLRKKAI